MSSTHHAHIFRRAFGNRRCLRITTSGAVRERTASGEAAPGPSSAAPRCTCCGIRADRSAAAAGINLCRKAETSSSERRSSWDTHKHTHTHTTLRATGAAGCSNPLTTAAHRERATAIPQPAGPPCPAPLRERRGAPLGPRHPPHGWQRPHRFSSRRRVAVRSSAVAPAPPPPAGRRAGRDGGFPPPSATLALRCSRSVCLSVCSSSRGRAPPAHLVSAAAQAPAEGGEERALDIARCAYVCRGTGGSSFSLSLSPRFAPQLPAARGCHRREDGGQEDLSPTIERKGAREAGPRRK